MNSVMRSIYVFCCFFIVIAFGACGNVSEKEVRIVYSFNDNWKFSLGDDSLRYTINYDDSQWRELNLPHDWSIEGNFDESHNTGQFGGALPAGIGWYRKTFISPENIDEKLIRVEFDGVYRNSEVWINEHYLGVRPFGYISFQYDITPYLYTGDTLNVMAVRVNNEDQPNSRWYTGSGIYRDVRLTSTKKIRVAHWGTFVTTPNVSKESADVKLEVTIDKFIEKQSSVKVSSSIIDSNGKVVTTSDDEFFLSDPKTVVNQSFVVENPQLWSPELPQLYSVETKIYKNSHLMDSYTTPLGIRYFHFDAEKGFFLNDQSLKIHGVCLHHDLGALGAAYNRRANQRQLEIMKSMGVNAIRTSHNPFDPQFYELCDEMGFLVMDESFDVWMKGKTKEDYHVDFEEWHERDLRDMVLRDRNHPSVFMYSIGNEIREQFDSTGLSITRQLVDIVKELDSTRPVTSGLTENQPHLNYITQSEALDVLGFNYKHEVYDSLMCLFPGKSIIASENVSGFATRGVYNMPSDSIQIWPTAHDKPLVGANDDFTVSSYDNIHSYWGSTHADNWRMIKKHDYVSGVFIWTGIDYIGEPSPYPYPARSSYFGLVDLAGFPKDSYYMYQSEWTDNPVLHLFPHWNWRKGQTVDVWTYYNFADEVELFVNDISKGVRSKSDSTFHVMWRIPFEPGVLKAVSRKDGKEVLVREIKTSGEPALIKLDVDRQSLSSYGDDLAFVTVTITDKDGVPVPHAQSTIRFKVEGSGKLVGVDNGYQADLNSFKNSYVNAFNGKCLAIIQAGRVSGDIKLYAESDGLTPASVLINVESGTQ